MATPDGPRKGSATTALLTARGKRQHAWDSRVPADLRWAKMGGGRLGEDGTGGSRAAACPRVCKLFGSWIGMDMMELLAPAGVYFGVRSMSVGRLLK